MKFIIWYINLNLTEKVEVMCLGHQILPKFLFLRIFKRDGMILHDIYRLFENFPENFSYFKDTLIISLTIALNCKSLPPDKYMELTELALVVLGHPLAKIQWRTQGPAHHSKWMTKLIYALKIFLF